MLCAYKKKKKNPSETVTSNKPKSPILTDEDTIMMTKEADSQGSEITIKLHTGICVSCS